MALDRREFLRQSASWAALPMSSGLAQATPELPSPDFHYDRENPPFIACLRPYREGSYRLEVDRSIDDRLLVHNYGYGGAGITMSWGSAWEVHDLVRSSALGRRESEVAILGAGVMGLTAAKLLVEAGYQVSIYAERFYKDTTSYRAGGQFAPSIVAFADKGRGRQQFDRILRRSFLTHLDHLGRTYGVSRRPNFNYGGRSTSLERVPKEVIPEPQFFERLPFAGHSVSGYCYDTLLIEPPIFLKALENDLRTDRVGFKYRRFDDLAGVLALREAIVVNCMGLGAAVLGNDDEKARILPIKGELVMLPAQTHLAYLYTGHGYIFPREDAVVVGGSYIRGDNNPCPDQDRVAGFLDYAASGFAKAVVRKVEKVQPPLGYLHDSLL